MLQNAVFRRICSDLVPLGPKIVFFPNIFPPNDSTHKVYNLAGKLINLLECLAVSRKKAPPWEVFMVMASLKGGLGGGGGGLVSGGAHPPSFRCRRLLNLPQGVALSQGNRQILDIV